MADYHEEENSDDEPTMPTYSEDSSDEYIREEALYSVWQQEAQFRYSKQQKDALTAEFEKDPSGKRTRIIAKELHCSELKVKVVCICV